MNMPKSTAARAIHTVRHLPVVGETQRPVAS